MSDLTLMDTRQFLLWRQDDNGNRFLVGAFAGEEAALARMAELTRMPHRQTYWVECEADLRSVKR